MDQIKPDITAQIQELKTYGEPSTGSGSVEKAKVKLTPEIERFIRESVEKVQSKLVAKQPVTQADMAFIEEAKKMIKAEGFFQGGLRSRFEAHPERHPGIEFAEVEKVLLANPEAAASLRKMDETGGEPDVIGMEGDVFIFGDCSAESPVGRRRLPFSYAVKQADEFGIELMDEVYYRKLQSFGKFDTDTWSWLASPVEAIKRGVPLHGFRDVHDEVVVCGRGEWDATGSRGWRGMIRIKKA